MIGEIETLHPAFRFAVDAILQDMKAKGWDPVIGSGMRSNEQQDAIYAQGRKPLEVVNTLRVGTGLSRIAAAENRRPVTYARGGESNHNKAHSMLPHGRGAVDVTTGYAVDIVDRRHGWEPRDVRFWDELGRAAKKHGCVWGGDWKGKKRDVAHVEMKLIDSAPRTSFEV